MSAEPSPDTLRLLYHHLKGAPFRRIRDGNRQESKAINVFAAATILIGLAGVAHPSPTNLRWLVVLLSVLAVVAYAAAVGGTVFTIWPRAYRAADYDDTLWPTFWDMTPSEIQHAIIEDITAGASANKRANALRENGVYWVLGATAAEGLVVAAILILVRVALG